MAQNKRNEIIAKAWKDPAFKKKLMRNPKETLESMGVNIPANTTVRVIEDSANTITFVLPSAPENFSQLSERELESVAGGDDGGGDKYAPPGSNV